MTTICRRYYLSCLSFGLTVVCFRSVLGRSCDPLGFTDVASRTYRADVVLDVHRIPGGRRAAKEARFQVNDVLKGSLERDSNTGNYPKISAGNFSVRPNSLFCVAPLPQVGSRYVLFLNSKTTSSSPLRSGGGSGRNSSSGGAAAVTADSTVFSLSSFPVEFSDKVADAVRSSSNSTYGKKPRLRMRSNESLSLRPNATLRLQCVASGRPKPKVLWYINETLLNETKHVTFLGTKRGSTLLIRRVNLTDAGTYRCQAVNVVGRTSLKSVNGITVTVTNSSSHSVPCERQGYCLNGGTCMLLVALQNRMHCRCDRKFTGERCEEKVTGIPNVVMGKVSRKKF